MTVASVKNNTILKIIIAEDYIKYQKYADVDEEDEMSYLRPKGIYLINYIEQLFLRLFNEDIEEFIEKELKPND